MTDTTIPGATTASDEGSGRGNDLDELKRFVVAHAISQNLPADHYAPLLDRITTDTGDAPGSWAYEWIRAGDELDAAGQTLAAGQYYVLGRFPFVDGPGRARALERSVDAFDRWRKAEDTGIEPQTVDVDGVPVRIWTAGLSAEEPRPLLVLTGGIVSTKEQWGPLLPQLTSLGLAGAVAELPGVGENVLRYERGSTRLFTAILDTLDGRADVSRTYLLALSFSGHLALRTALADPRIRGIVGNGTPVHDFFTDGAWQRNVPRITRDTLAHLVGVPAGTVYAQLRDWAIGDDELRALDVPFATVSALRDEIVPPGDTARLRRHVSDLRLLEHDDVHGAPGHLAETKVWSLLAVQRMRPDADPAITAGLVAAVEAARAAGATR
ncbi:alpha/beta hydrolase [Streptomyces sp. NPDC056660]|uniref:alpha/beta hydrolase n=1 Tax=Streptomyces sp. NPDC056660 TaxID=3345897 RepID=UPI003676EA06